MIIGRLTLSNPLIQNICHHLLTLEVMAFITCNQHMGYLSFTEQATFTPFAIDGVVGKVNNSALLLRIVFY